MNRPTGVAVLAILLFILSAFAIIGAIGLFVGGAFIGAMIAHNSGFAGGGAMGAAIGGFLGVGFLIAAGLNIACGYGLWNLREWGRMLTIILSAIGIFFALLNLMHFHAFVAFFVLIRLAIGVLIIWYLSQPQVKAAFVPPAQPQPYVAR